MQTVVNFLQLKIFFYEKLRTSPSGRGLGEGLVYCIAPDDEVIGNMIGDDKFYPSILGQMASLLLHKQKPCWVLSPVLFWHSSLDFRRKQIKHRSTFTGDLNHPCLLPLSDHNCEVEQDKYSNC